MKRILVTGASGFIGRNLVGALMSKGHSPYRMSRRSQPFHPLLGEDLYVQCDLRDAGQVKKVMERVKPEVVFHLAGNPIIKGSEEDPSGATHDNAVGTHNLLAFAPANCRFVLASSAAVYGDQAVGFVGEDAPLAPTSAYGASKIAAEALVEAYANMGLVSGVSLRLVANVGRWATHGVVLDLLRKLHGPSEYLDLLGAAPGSRKHLMYVGDTAAAFIHFGLGFGTSFQGQVNIANDTVLYVSDIASLLIALTKIQKRQRWLGDAANWRGDNRAVEVSNRLARSLGWSPYYDESAEALKAGAAELLAQKAMT